MKWLVIGIMLVGMGCIALKNNTYPKPCENSPLAFNKKTGLYECVDKECFNGFFSANSIWYKMSPQDVIHFLGKPTETKSYPNGLKLTYKTNESTCITGVFKGQSFGLVEFGFKYNKMEYANTISLIEPDPMK